MALTPNELYVETTTGAAPQMRAYDSGTARVEFAAPVADITYEPATPVARNSSTGKWVVWANGGANDTGTIRGFVYHVGVNAELAGEVIGVIMLRGEVAYEDVVLPAGEVQANLDAALKAIFVTSGITNLDVLNLDGAK